MSQKDNLIIHLQDLTTLENTLVIWLYFTIGMIAVFLVAAFIARKELLKSLSPDFYVANSSMPKLLRIMMIGFGFISAISLAVSVALIFKLQDVRFQLKDHSIMLENTAKDEAQRLVEQLEKEQMEMPPITEEEFQQIDREIRQHIGQAKEELQKEAEKRATIDPTTTVEIELHKLMNGIKSNINQTQGVEYKPTERDPNKSPEENLNAVVEAIFNEPLKQVQENQEQKK